jgi:hypothetical protein
VHAVGDPLVGGRVVRVEHGERAWSVLHVEALVLFAMLFVRAIIAVPAVG